MKDLYTKPHMYRFLVFRIPPAFVSLGGLSHYKCRNCEVPLSLEIVTPSGPSCLLKPIETH